MTTQAQIARESVRAASKGRLEGEIASDPADVTELVRVKVPNPGGKPQEFGPLRWGPERDGVLPQPGDRCVIEQAANTRQWWVTCWWPLDYEEA